MINKIFKLLFFFNNAEFYKTLVCILVACRHLYTNCELRVLSDDYKQSVSFRDISKNSLLSFRTFLYWTLLGFCHAFVFFFGSYILMGEDTTLMGNGQVCAWFQDCRERNLAVRVGESL